MTAAVSVNICWLAAGRLSGRSLMSRRPGVHYPSPWKQTSGWAVVNDQGTLLFLVSLSMVLQKIKALQIHVVFPRIFFLGTLPRKREYVHCNDPWLSSNGWF